MKVDCSAVIGAKNLSSSTRIPPWPGLRTSHDQILRWTNLELDHYYVPSALLSPLLQAIDVIQTWSLFLLSLLFCCPGRAHAERSARIDGHGWIHATDPTSATDQSTTRMYSPTRHGFRYGQPAKSPLVRRQVRGRDQVNLLSFFPFFFLFFYLALLLAVPPHFSFIFLSPFVIDSMSTVFDNKKNTTDRIAGWEKGWYLEDVNQRDLAA